MAQVGERSNDEIDAFVSLESPYVSEEWVGRAEGRVRGEELCIDAIINDTNPFARNASLNEVVSSAFAHGLERKVAIKRTYWPLCQPECSRERRGSFTKRRRSEQMMHKRDELIDFPKRSVQRRFIQVFNDNVVSEGLQVSLVITVRQERIGVARSNAMHIDPVDLYATRCIPESAAQQIDSVSARSKSSENLMQMKLGATALRILPILPVEDQDPH
jgi:hypothetical protein